MAVTTVWDILVKKNHTVVILSWYMDFLYVTLTVQLLGLMMFVMIGANSSVSMKIQYTYVKDVTRMEMKLR